MRAVKPQWRDSRVGDLATIQCGRSIFRKRITKIYRGTLARVFLEVNYRRVFPDAATVFDAVKTAKKIYPDADEFMAFELEEFM